MIPTAGTDPFAEPLLSPEAARVLGALVAAGGAATAAALGDDNVPMEDDAIAGLVNDGLVVEWTTSRGTAVAYQITAAGVLRAEPALIFDADGIRAWLTAPDEQDPQRTRAANRRIDDDWCTDPDSSVKLNDALDTVDQLLPVLAQELLILPTAGRVELRLDIVSNEFVDSFTLLVFRNGVALAAQREETLTRIEGLPPASADDPYPGVTRMIELLRSLVADANQLLTGAASRLGRLDPIPLSGRFS